MLTVFSYYPYGKKGVGGNVGHMFVAMDISKLGTPDDYKARVEGMIDEIKASKKANGVEKIIFREKLKQ